MAKFFIHRPIVAMVISLVILICGGISILVLPIARFPDISPPCIKVNIQYPGADAETIAQSIAIPLEQQINGAEDMIYMSSTSTSDGQYNLSCTFKVGRDADMANVDINNRVNKAMALLPSSATAQGVTVTKQSPNMLMVVSVYSPNRTYDDIFLSNYASIQMVDAINRTEGVGNTTIVGQRDYSMRLWLDPEKLSKLGVTASDIAGVVNEQNVLAPSGSIGQPPTKPGTQIQYTVNVKGRLTDVEEFGNMIVKAQPDGSFLRMKDVARIELASRYYTSFGCLDDGPAALILIYQLPGGNAVDTTKKLYKLLKDLEPNMPPGLACKVTLDTTKFITVSIEKVLEALRDAVILVLIVVFIFLGSFRATFIPMLAVPVSLIGTFAAFIALGFSINTLTLFGIVLAVGIVVDDAIVVVEAVESHIEKGLTPLEATEKALEEVQAPVIAIALVLCAVFVPVAFMGGITGQLYKQFAITLAVSVVLSAIVALSLTPALCTKILKHRTESKGLFGMFFGAFNKVFGWVTGLYTGTVKFLIHYAIIGILILIAIYYGAFHLVTKTPTAFVPDEDQGYFFVVMQLPDGASYERNAAFAKNICDYTLTLKGVNCVSTLGGLNLMNTTMNCNTSSLVVMLDDWEERRTKETSIKYLMKHVRDYSLQFPEGIAIPVLPAPIPGLGNAGGFQFELQDTEAHSLDELDKVKSDFMAEAAKDPALTALSTGYRTTVPQLDLKINRDMARNMGININSIFQTVQIFLGGVPVNDFNLFDRVFKVYIQAENEFRENPDSIKRLYVGTVDGKMVPLSSISKIVEANGPSLVQRYNMFKTAEITGSSAAGYSSGQGMDAMEKLAKKVLPPGYSYSWTGTAFQEKESGSSQVIILALALIFVFLFLAAQYESWAIPFSVILGLPIALLGAYFAITSVGIQANIFVQIGIVMLIGLAAKNAILIVEFAKERYEKGGMSLVDAAVEGARVRFRPIMMTSFAFILGVVPLATCTGAGAGQQRSLGIAVFGGMLAASAIGIFFIPLLYVLMQRIGNLFSRKGPGKGKTPPAAAAVSGEAEGMDAGQQEAARRETEQKEAAHREAERKEAERQEAARREAERKEAERQEAARREAERKEAARREAERKEAERQEAARREAERKEAERQEAARRDAERKEAARREAERKEAERQEAARREAERKEAARRDTEKRKNDDGKGGRP